MLLVAEEALVGAVQGREGGDIPDIGSAVKDGLCNIWLIGRPAVQPASLSDCSHKSLDAIQESPLVDVPQCPAHHRPEGHTHLYTCSAT